MIPEPKRRYSIKKYPSMLLLKMLSRKMRMIVNVITGIKWRRISPMYMPSQY